VTDSHARGRQAPRSRRPSTGQPALDALLTDLARADTSLEERVVNRRVFHRGRFMTFEQDTVVLPDGARASRDVVYHPGAVAILALDADDRLLLVRQYRVPPARALLEIPAGTLDEGDSGPEEPAAAARRELEEETGFRAGSLERLGGFWTAPGFSSEYITIFLATDLSPAREGRLGPDEDERLELVHLAWPEALAAVEAGVIEDAKSTAAILWLARRRATARPRGQAAAGRSPRATPARKVGRGGRLGGR
jgi:ADP-ribose pyrophosphatase